MYGGRIIYGSGCGTTSVTLFYAIKVFVPRNSAVIITPLIILVCRMCSTLNVWASTYLFTLTNSFTMPLVLTLIACILSTGFYVLYVEIQRKKEAYLLNNVTELEFKCNEFKDFSLRAYMLIILNVTTYAVYWTFQSMMNQILRDGFS